MLFNSYVFIFIFLPVVLVGYYWVNKHAQRQWAIAWLMLASLVYYSWWKPAFVILLLISIFANAGFGKILCNRRISDKTSAAVLIAGIAFNLAVLGYFKYAGFFVANVNSLFGAGLTIPQIVLPLGISFITFQKIAFLVDAFRGNIKGFTFLNFALFVTFFPQLIAGPIVHHAEVMPQFAKKTNEPDLLANLEVGTSIFCVGLFKKTVVADSCAVYADAGYGILADGHPLDSASAWIAVIAYSFQIYYDFSGYSDMAVGLARMFGVHFPANFFSPYKASSIVDFWRRWHMTLSRFLRDYLYIPLGGNRRGTLRQYANLGVVMLFGGLWHGANWTFVVWGALHGFLLIINHAWNRSRLGSRAPSQSLLARGTAISLTYLTVILAWVPFRASNLSDAGRMLTTLFPFGQDVQATWASFQKCWRMQFGDLQLSTDLMTWFKPRELWPAVLPPDFLASYRPACLQLAIIAVATFFLPNTSQIFARFRPVLGLSNQQLYHRASLNALDWKVAMVVSAMFVYSTLQLIRVSPFLYYNF